MPIEKLIALALCAVLAMLWFILCELANIRQEAETIRKLLQENRKTQV